jgi:hypothetical protein
MEPPALNPKLKMQKVRKRVWLANITTFKPFNSLQNQGIENAFFFCSIFAILVQTLNESIGFCELQEKKLFLWAKSNHCHQNLFLLFVSMWQLRQ